MSRITEWAGRRWTDRFPAGVNPALRLSDTIPEGTMVYSALAKEVENRRIELRIALSSLGADDAVLLQLTEFEDAVGLLGVLIGASMETEDIDPAGTTPEAAE